MTSAPVFYATAAELPADTARGQLVQTYADSATAGDGRHVETWTRVWVLQEPLAGGAARQTTTTVVVTTVTPPATN